MGESEDCVWYLVMVLVVVMLLADTIQHIIRPIMYVRRRAGATSKWKVDKGFALPKTYHGP